jgi:hypothetical protein
MLGEFMRGGHGSGAGCDVQSGIELTICLVSKHGITSHRKTYNDNSKYGREIKGKSSSSRATMSHLSNFSLLEQQDGTRGEM